MGYYENPPIVAPNRSSDVMASYILDASNSVANALNKIGERKRQAEKEERLTIQKLQDRKNQSDLYYNQKYNDWKEKESPISGDVDTKIQTLIQQKISIAADNRVKLLNEIDPKLIPDTLTKDQVIPSELEANNPSLLPANQILLLYPREIIGEVIAASPDVDSVQVIPSELYPKNAVPYHFPLKRLELNFSKTQALL